MESFNMTPGRGLRISTLITTGIAIPFLIALTIISIQDQHYWYKRREVTAFCFTWFPIAFTAVASTTSIWHQRKYGRMPGPRFALLDLFTGVLYLSVLLPIWIVEIFELHQASKGMLVGYLTVSMIINMLVHFFFFVCHAKSMWLSFTRETVHQCPHCNCGSNYVVGGAQAQKTGSGGENYSLLRGEEYLDGDAVPYVDTRTSEEQIRPEGEKGEGKGKAIIDV